jgi:fructokinase
MVSRLGRDELGRKARDEVVALGMDPSHIQWDEEHPTGTVEVSFDDNHNPDYYIVPGVAYDNIDMSDALAKVAAAADCLCFGTLIQRTDRSRRTLGGLLEASPRSIKLLDINLRKECHTLETVQLSLEEADILKLNDDEARQLAGMFSMRKSECPAFCLEAMERWALSHCLVTFGERGAFAASRGGGEYYVPGYKVDLVDSCGSGDAFTAGFIHLHLAGKPLRECCDLANILGAIVATQAGATVPISESDVRRFTDGEHERLFQMGLEKFAAL